MENNPKHMNDRSWKEAMACLQSSEPSNDTGGTILRYLVTTDQNNRKKLIPVEDDGTTETTGTKRTIQELGSNESTNMLDFPITKKICQGKESSPKRKLPSSNIVTEDYCEEVEVDNKRQRIQNSCDSKLEEQIESQSSSKQDKAKSDIEEERLEDKSTLFEKTVAEENTNNNSRKEHLEQQEVHQDFKAISDEENSEVTHTFNDLKPPPKVTDDVSEIKDIPSILAKLPCDKVDVNSTIPLQMIQNLGKLEIVREDISSIVVPDSMKNTPIVNLYVIQKGESGELIVDMNGNKSHRSFKRIASWLLSSVCSYFVILTTHFVICSVLKGKL